MMFTCFTQAIHDLLIFPFAQGFCELYTFFSNCQEFDNEWCNEGRFGADHTMCIYEEGAKSICGDVQVPGITSQVKLKRNYLRHLITSFMILVKFSI